MLFDLVLPDLVGVALVVAVGWVLGTVGATAGVVAGMVAGGDGEGVVVEGGMLPGIGTTGTSVETGGGSGFLNGSSQV